MFKKLRLQFSLFCILVTGTILAAMSGLCLYISESNASRQSFLSFENNVGSMLSYLEDQSVITHRWIRELNSHYGLLVKIFDGENPFFYDQLNYDAATEELFARADAQAKKDSSVFASPSRGSRLIQHTEFCLESPRPCYASVALIPRQQTSLRVITIHDPWNEQAARYQRYFLFLLAVLGAALLLAVFSWFFIGHILTPVEENRRQKTAFIAAASHELRAPLTVILSGLSAMEGADPAMQTVFRKSITEEGLRMKLMIDELLLLANADSRNWPMHPGKTEPDTLLLEVYEKYQPLAAEKKISLDILLPAQALPPQTWDSDRILQVMGILLDNALEYTPVSGKIRLSLTQINGKIEYRVADSGPGIPDNEKSIVFQRFYRSDNRHRDRAHFGLGLSIAREIVHLHGGRIHVEDAPEGGAVFVILL